MILLLLKVFALIVLIYVFIRLNGLVSVLVDWPVCVVCVFCVKILDERPIELDRLLESEEKLPDLVMVSEGFNLVFLQAVSIYIDKRDAINIFLPIPC